MNANSLIVHAQDISQVTAYKPGYGITSTASGSGVNVRTQPNLTNSEIIRSIPNNTRIMIVGQSGDWYYVQYDTSGHYGYMSKDYVNFMPENYYLRANTTLNMYEERNTSSSVIATIPSGTYFAYWLVLGNWYKGIYGIAFGYVEKTGVTRYSY